MKFEYETTIFVISMLCYLLAFVGFTVSVSFEKKKLYAMSRVTQITGAILATVALLLRWQSSGHPPLSNMYESMVTLSTFLAIAGFLFTWKKPLPLLEAGASVGAVLMIGIASIFSIEVRPLIPALQSYWLHLHVSLAFIGEACFALAFIMSYLYCFRQQLSGDLKKGSHSLTERWLCSIVVFGLPASFVGGMILLATYLSKHPKYQETWQRLVIWVILPSCLVVVALVLIAYLFRGAIGERTEKWLPEPEVLDDLTYRAIALGFPLFTVGGLIFGMVWANKAWGRYWGWDPKETWALITFLVYSAYLHVRLTRGLKGVWTACISVLGFLVTMFTLFGVNMLISSLHSYAGV